MLISAPKREVRNWLTDSRLWKHYKPRSGDVIVGTAAKCGTTWTQQILSLLVFQSPEPRDIGSLSPWIDCRFGAPAEVVTAMLESQSHRRFMKTHTQFDAIPVYDEVFYIHVARYGLDACLSWRDHLLIMRPDRLVQMDTFGMADPGIGRPFPRPKNDPKEFFNSWISDDTTLQRDSYPAAVYFDLERTYWAVRKLPNMLLVHYADLKADLEGEMRRIAEFLKIDVPAAAWPDLVEAASFEAMKRNSAQIGPAWDRGFTGGLNAFLAKGTNARWRDVLTPDDVTRFDERARRELSPGLGHWLKDGRLVAGEPRTSTD